MLTTEFATMDIKSHGNTADLVFSYKGPGFEGDYTVDEFAFELSDIPYETEGSERSFNSDNITGVISYSLVYNKDNQKQGTLTRAFSVSGAIDKANPSNSSVTFTATVFDKQLTLLLRNIVTKQSDAEFGKQGYPIAPIIDRISAKRLFLNNSGHDVTVGHEAAFSSYRDFVTIKAGSSDRLILLDGEDIKAAYTFKFDDGRISRHTSTEKPYEYTGIPVDVKERPFLYFDAGIIHYDKNYDVSYIITPEIYEHASYIE